jgi:hypothetical protein
MASIGGLAMLAWAAPFVSGTVPAAMAQGSFPTAPPAQVCGNAALLTGPSTPPAGAIVVPAGDNSAMKWNQPGATFYLAAGSHTLGNGQYSQILPAANTHFVGAPGAVVDGQGRNQYAFTQTAVGVTIRYLTVQNFVAPRDQGVVNHDSGANWTIQYNTVVNNAGAGVMVGPGDTVSYNCLKSNGQYGFSAYRAGGDSNITVDHNEITGNNTGNWDVVVPGCGCVGGGKLWNTIGGSVTNNWVHNNVGPGIWADTNNAGILIDANYIADNDDEAIIYEISYNAAITNNNLLRNGLVKGQAFAKQGTNFPVAAIYISESGGDSRVDGGLYATFNIAGNNLVDNWGGVTLWENADRFCGSPANTSATFCTMVNPKANFSTCVAGTVNNAPYLSDCRWKTQNISVHDNLMSFSRANVGCTGTVAGCGQETVVSNYGSSPTWSPYKGTTVQSAITYQQNNHFANNTYTGDWQFVPLQPGGTVSFSSWQAGPTNQDSGSTLNAPPPAPDLLSSLLAGLGSLLGPLHP